LRSLYEETHKLSCILNASQQEDFLHVPNIRNKDVYCLGDALLDVYGICHTLLFFRSLSAPFCSYASLTVIGEWQVYYGQRGLPSSFRFTHAHTLEVSASR
jgi:hypothetical protein